MELVCVAEGIDDVAGSSSSSGSSNCAARSIIRLAPRSANVCLLWADACVGSAVAETMLTSEMKASSSVNTLNLDVNPGAEFIVLLWRLIVAFIEISSDLRFPS